MRTIVRQDCYCSRSHRRAPWRQSPRFHQGARLEAHMLLERDDVLHARVQALTPSKTMMSPLSIRPSVSRMRRTGLRNLNGQYLSYRSVVALQTTGIVRPLYEHHAREAGTLQVRNATNHHQCLRSPLKDAVAHYAPPPTFLTRRRMPVTVGNNMSITHTQGHPALCAISLCFTNPAPAPNPTGEAARHLIPLPREYHAQHGKGQHAHVYGQHAHMPLGPI
jgi:hypothetical protein